MEIFEIINRVLDKDNLTKRDFAAKLIALEPKSHRTGEIISEKTIYAYLNGTTTIQADLIPYIAEVLKIPEQILFEETPKIRMKTMKYILNDISVEEKLYLKKFLNSDTTSTTNTLNEIIEHMPYASEALLDNFLATLKEMKTVTEQFEQKNKPST